MVCERAAGRVRSGQARAYAHLASQLRHPLARSLAPISAPSRSCSGTAASAPRPSTSTSRTAALESTRSPFDRPRLSPNRRVSAMTRPRLEVAEVIRSCHDAFLQAYGASLTPEQRRVLRRSGRLPHGGPGWTRPGVPAVRAPGGRLQLLRQPPLPQVPGHGRGAVAGDPGCRLARHTVLPRRVHAPRMPSARSRLTTPAEVYGLLMRAAAETLLEVAADPEAPGGRDRRAGGAAHLGPEPRSCTPMSIAWSPAAGCRPTRAAGSPAVTTSSCPSTSSAGCSGASSWPGFAPPSARVSSASRVELAALARPERFNRSAVRVGADRLGRSCQAAVGRPRDGPEVPGPVHSQGRHQQPPPDRVWRTARSPSAGRTTPTAGRQRTMTLDAIEFVRRFLMHVLPSGFVRIRHYGILANCHRQEKLARCRELLAWP